MRRHRQGFQGFWKEVPLTEISEDSVCVCLLVVQEKLILDLGNYLSLFLVKKIGSCSWNGDTVIWQNNSHSSMSLWSFSAKKTNLRKTFTWWWVVMMAVISVPSAWRVDSWPFVPYADRWLLTIGEEHQCWKKNTHFGGLKVFPSVLQRSWGQLCRDSSTPYPNLFFQWPQVSIHAF